METSSADDQRENAFEDGWSPATDDTEIFYKISVADNPNLEAKITDISFDLTNVDEFRLDATVDGYEGDVFLMQVSLGSELSLSHIYIL